MIRMLCRNRVADFAKWKQVFDSHAEAHREVGLKLVEVWRALEDQNNVFFLFAVSDLEKAKAFIATPEAAETGKAAGVLDGEYHFVESI
jgi:hypothetical protein